MHNSACACCAHKGHGITRMDSEELKLSLRETQAGGLRSLDDQHVTLGDQDCPDCCGSAGPVATVCCVAPLEIAVLCEKASQM